MGSFPARASALVVLAAAGALGCRSGAVYAPIVPYARGPRPYWSVQVLTVPPSRPYVEAGLIRGWGRALDVGVAAVQWEGAHRGCDAVLLLGPPKPPVHASCLYFYYPPYVPPPPIASPTPAPVPPTVPVEPPPAAETAAPAEPVVEPPPETPPAPQPPAPPPRARRRVVPESCPCPAPSDAAM